MSVEFVSLFACKSDLTILLWSRRAFCFATCARQRVSSSVLLRNARLSVCSLGAIRGPARSQNPCENRRENRPKIAPGRGPGDPKWRQNRVRDPLGTLLGAQDRLEDVSGASSERLGASPGRPGSARGMSKSAPGRQKDRQGAPGSVPRRPKSTPSRVQERKNCEFDAHVVRKASSERFSADFRTIFAKSVKMQKSHPAAVWT